jgi:hypothetical protein
MIRKEANVDCIFLFPGKYEGMVEQIRAVKDYLRESSININLKKCEILKIGRDIQEQFLLTDDLTGKNHELSCAYDIR